MTIGDHRMMFGFGSFTPPSPPDPTPRASAGSAGDTGRHVPQEINLAAALVRQKPCGCYTAGCEHQPIVISPIACPGGAICNCEAGRPRIGDYIRPDLYARDINAWLDEQKKAHHDRRERENDEPEGGWENWCEEDSIEARGKWVSSVLSRAMSQPAPHDTPWSKRAMLGGIGR